MNKRIAILLLLICAASESIAARFKISEYYEFERIISIPVVDLWSMAPPLKIDSGGISVTYQLYDPELRPRRGSWTGCAIVLIGTGDLGVVPVAFKVWSQRGCHITISETASRNIKSSAFTMKFGASENLQINITNEASVSVQGVKVGRIKQPK